MKCLATLAAIASVVALTAFSSVNAAAAVISGNVINDVNFNGVVDAGDYARDNVTVNLYDSSHTLIQSKQNSSFTGYSFTVSTTGTYFVQVVPLNMTMPTNAIPGGAFATRVDNATLQVNVTDTGATYGGNLLLISTMGHVIICGNVINDLNCNGNLDAGEPLIGGIKVSLYDSTGTTLLTSTVSKTTAPGFDFMVSPGTYVLKAEPDAPGFVTAASSSTGSSVTVNQLNHSITIHATNLDLYSVQTFLVCQQGVPPEGRLGLVKFYDVNGNGVMDPEDTPLGGVRFVVQILDAGGNVTSSETLTTDAFGSAVSSVLALGANFRICEVIPSTGTASAFWMQTLPNASTPGTALYNGQYCYVGTVGANDVFGFSFGDVCASVGSTNAKTKGFWHNRNGQALITSDDLAALRALNLVNADGTPFDPTDKTQLINYLTNDSNASNMANQLSAQLAAMTLNIRHGFVPSTAIIDCGPGLGTDTIGHIVQLADQALAADGNTLPGDPNRDLQAMLESCIDNGNNNIGFLGGGNGGFLPTPCPVIYP